MSEGVRTPPNGGFRFKVRGPRDFYGGLALIALAILGHRVIFPARTALPSAREPRLVCSQDCWQSSELWSR
jgi:hypothetical protein